MSRVSLVRLEKGRRISEGRLALETLGDPLTIEPSAEVQMAKRNMAPEMGAVHNSGYGNSRKADGLDYSIAAIPTVYRGRKYRSRLEAKWAAMFDLLGWQHEYEPYDLGSWSPDFLLSGVPGFPILVEVKPITTISLATCKKMADAVYERGMQTQVSALLLVGAAPTLRKDPAGIQVGWVALLGDDVARADVMWATAPLLWLPHMAEPKLVPDMIQVSPDHKLWAGLLTPKCGEINTLPDTFYPDHTMELWARASNAAQWSPST